MRDDRATVNLDALPAAIRRAWPLLEDPPDQPDARHGYLDLLGPEPAGEPGLVQAIWSSTPGARAYEYAQAVVRRLITAAGLPDAALRLPPGGRALDVGSGPGNITASLGRAAGPDGLALGVDISEPMLRRAVGAWTAANVGFLRADAQALPFRAGTFHSVTCLAALQLVPEPFAALDQMCRVLAPGGHLVVAVPTARGGMLDRVVRLTGRTAGVAFFDPGEVADHLQANGIDTVHTRQRGSFLSVIAHRR